ncbi:MAG: histidine kinase N-terminal 7TM domain-containing protein [Anaerolineales bacterium]
MVISFLQTLNELLTAGVAITTFSLLLYVLTFNLQNRVARSFAFILACVTGVFSGEALASTLSVPGEVAFWLRFEWVALVFLPASYFYASDALMETVGRPSRGRRRLLTRLNFSLAAVFLLLLPGNWLVQNRLQKAAPAPSLLPGSLLWIFVLYYVLMILWAGTNFMRSYRLTLVATSRRRMRYLMAGATAPALGSFPYLILGTQWAGRSTILFWLLAVASNVVVSALLVLMAYALAFFGVAWPDRVVKNRLFRWILRGPVTASTVLAVATITRRAGEHFGTPYNAFVPILMVATILGMEYSITLFSPWWERWLFGAEDYNIRVLKNMEERLLSERDLKQFIESVLAAVCEQLRSRRAFVAALNADGLQRIITVGHWRTPQDILPDAELLERASALSDDQVFFTWGNFWVMPLFAGQQLLGLMITECGAADGIDEDQRSGLQVLVQRAALALYDHHLQRQVVESLQALQPEMDVIQQWRAASRYGSSLILAAAPPALENESLSRWVKDALSHFWGGPKLSESPLLNLQIVQDAVNRGENPANALRTVLKQAVENVRPSGDRRFTAEWILYNILEMKFMEGHKVRDIALRLAMSEADFYRKQRVAIEEVARNIVEMEEKRRQHQTETTLQEERA